MEVKNVNQDKKKVNVSGDNPSLQRIENRCTNCGMCFRVCENIVGIDHSLEKEKKPLCINCGQCIMNCPTGALCTKFSYKKILNLIKDTNIKVAISIAPAVRTSIFEEFGLSESNTSSEKLLPTILRNIGFSYVFDVCFAADVTIMEEATELINRIKKQEKLPIFTSCCPSWVKYLEIFHPKLIPNLSTTKSPISIQSTLIKTYFKDMSDINEDIISVVVAPCTAKKYEMLNSDTDYVITVQELAMLFRECNIDFSNIPESDFDSLLGVSSKSGLMFGRSGGVMEAALNCAYYLINKKNPPKNYFKLEIKEGITTASYKMGIGQLDIAIVYGMKNLEKFLPDMENYDFVEVMNCPEGCVGGGGQPLLPIRNVGDARINRIRLLNENFKRDVVFCYQNPEVKDLYNSYLSHPLSNKSVKLLHTKHNDLSSIIKQKKMQK